MTLQDKEMLNDLIVESREHLTAIEPDLLELEQKGDSISGELINRIFRAVHSIKGGFGFFGIEHVTKLSHIMENVMSRIRDKKLSIAPEVTDALLKGVDKLRALLDDVGHADAMSIDSEIENLNPFLDLPEGIKHEKPAAPKVPASGIDASVSLKHPDLVETQITEAVRNGKVLYQITVNSHTDLINKNITPMMLLETWEKFGDILDISFDFDNISGIRGSSSKEILYSIIFSTVLEPDLVSTGTGINDEQIFALDITAIKTKLNQQVQIQKQEQKQEPKQKQEQRGESGGTAGWGGAPIRNSSDKSPKTESKIEDALRVKVGLLNVLMNLAGELVLSRNQLVQSLNRKLSEIMEGETLFKNVDLQIQGFCKTVLDAAKQNPQQIIQTTTAEQARLREAFLQSLAVRLIDVPGLNSIMQNIDMVTSLLQENIMQTRLQPISLVFAKFPRLVRDLAKKLGKEINLTMVGQDVELDKSIVEQLSDPLTHLIRNSVDHGVETQEDRIKAGKPVQGEVVLRAFHEGGKVHIQIEDDGAGINRTRVKEKVIAMGLLTADNLEKMTDREIDTIIMLPGFSTAQNVNDVSGRGVGMDVVKTNIERLGGTVDIESTPGKGTKITMELPLTLAIISSLIVSAGGTRFAIPQVGIEELVRVRAKDVSQKIDRLKNCEVMRLRGKLLPLVRLSDALGKTPTFVKNETDEREKDNRKHWSDRRKKTDADQVSPAVSEESTRELERRYQRPDRRTNVGNALKIIVLRYGEQHFGLVVDDVFDSEEIVVKPLSGFLKVCQCYAGSTIMGDGAVAMILDTNGIAILAGLKFSDLEKDIESEKEKFLRESNKALRELLLFSAGENGFFGVDLAMVARVEKVETSRVAMVGNKEFLKYDNRSLRLIRISDYLPVSASSVSGAYTYVIVPKGVKYMMGILADQVRDVVKIDSVLDKNNIRGNGIFGSAIINSALTIVIDVNAIFLMAEPELCA